MSTQVTAATRSASLNTNTLDVSSNLAIQVLFQTEQINSQVTREMTTTLKTFEKMLTEIQQTLNATIQENHLLKKEIIQLNTKIKENEALHTEEMKKNTQTIATLSKSMTELRSDLRAEKYERKEEFDALVKQYNIHKHGCPILLNIAGVPYWKDSGTPLNPFNT